MSLEEKATFNRKKWTKSKGFMMINEEKLKRIKKLLGSLQIKIKTWTTKSESCKVKLRNIRIRLKIYKKKSKRLEQ